ncbi:hypothetical protein SLA2020_520660 [Shorea laevis]
MGLTESDLKRGPPGPPGPGFPTAPPAATGPHDGPAKIRNRWRSNVTEDEVIECLDFEATWIGAVRFIRQRGKPHDEGAPTTSGGPGIIRPAVHLGDSTRIRRPGPPPQFFENKPDSGGEDDGYFPHDMDQKGFPASSVTSLDAFRDFIRKNEH